MRTPGRAGADRGIFYTAEMLVKREALRTDAQVVRALDNAWKRLAPAHHGGSHITWDGYLALFRKLYLLFKAQQREGYLEPAETLADIERDWAGDADSEGRLTKEATARCLFQLADLHTDAVDASSYASLIRVAIAGVTTSDGRWIEDEALLRKVRERAGGGGGGGGSARGGGPDFDRATFAEQVRMWGEIFQQGNLAATLGCGALRPTRRARRRVRRRRVAARGSGWISSRGQSSSSGVTSGIPPSTSTPFCDRAARRRVDKPFAPSAAPARAAASSGARASPRRRPRRHSDADVSLDLVRFGLDAERAAAAASAPTEAAANLLQRPPHASPATPRNATAAPSSTSAIAAAAITADAGSAGAGGLVSDRPIGGRAWLLGGARAPARARRLARRGASRTTTPTWRAAS